MSLQHGPGSLRFRFVCTNGQAAYKTVIDALPPSEDSGKRGVANGVKSLVEDWVGPFLPKQ